MCVHNSPHPLDRQDIKAESFRRAAGQYRLIATRLEDKIRVYKIMPNQEKKLNHRLINEWVRAGSNFTLIATITISTHAPARMATNTTNATDTTSSAPAPTPTTTAPVRQFNYIEDSILTAQSAMVYFPSAKDTSEWAALGASAPKETDQPWSHFKEEYHDAPLWHSHDYQAVSGLELLFFTTLVAAMSVYRACRNAL